MRVQEGQVQLLNLVACSAAAAAASGGTHPPPPCQQPVTCLAMSDTHTHVMDLNHQKHQPGIVN